MSIRPAKRANFQTKNYAKDLRANATVPEKLLWSALRGRRLTGLKFRRQHPIEPYVADFYCAAARLVIELDGRSHDDRSTYDQTRNEFLGSLGLMTLRISNDDVIHNLDGVLEFIATVALPRIQSRSPTSKPLP